MVLKLRAHNQLVGRLIGKQGSTIKKIMADTNSVIFVSKWVFLPFLCENFAQNLDIFVMVTFTSNKLWKLQNCEIGPYFEVSWQNYGFWGLFYRNFGPFGFIGLFWYVFTKFPFNCSIFGLNCENSAWLVNFRAYLRNFGLFAHFKVLFPEISVRLPILGRMAKFWFNCLFCGLFLTTPSKFRFICPIFRPNCSILIFPRIFFILKFRFSRPFQEEIPV